MSDFRYDPFFDQWVCIAESRQDRPVEYQQTVQRRADLECPFCAGNEYLTPPALQQIGDGAKTWLVRAIPNKFPALGSADKSDAGEFAGGWQEVLVVSPRHVASFAELSDDELVACLNLFQQRIRALAADPAVAHVSLFMNCRPAAGASIEHAHFQLLGSPVCTGQVRARLQRMQSVEGDSNRWRQQLERERASDRLVAGGDAFAVFCPFASRYTGQLRIAPMVRRSMRDLNGKELQVLGGLLRQWTAAVERVFEQPAYNIVFFFPPNDDADGPWFVDLIPRFPQAAGFELATDCWINPLSPETAARRYRGD